MFFHKFLPKFLLFFIFLKIFIKTYCFWAFLLYNKVVEKILKFKNCLNLKSFKFKFS